MMCLRYYMGWEAPWFRQVKNQMTRSSLKAMCIAVFSVDAPGQRGSICLCLRHLFFKLCFKYKCTSRVTVFVDFSSMHLKSVLNCSPPSHSCRKNEIRNVALFFILKWCHPFWHFIFLTAANLVLPQHFDRSKTSHWGMGSSLCSSGGDVTRKRDYMHPSSSALCMCIIPQAERSIAYCY